MSGTFRLIGFIGIVVAALTDHFIRVTFFPTKTSPIHRAQWLQKWSRRTLKCLNIEAAYHGSPPTAGLLVGNHLSYLDIPVLCARQPFVFVSKNDVRSWPMIGRLTRCAGTLFIQREKRGDVARLGREMEHVVRGGVVVVLFPEGTSSDGSAVLPFHSSLLAPAEEHGWPVAGACIHYELDDGSAAEEVCYWRDMTFGPHLLNLMIKKQIRAVVRFAPAAPAGMNRKEMARALHAEISRLNGLKSAENVSAFSAT